MRIGERTIDARIKPRETARRIYEQARQAGQRASLLEQQRPNVFQMNVANILPKDEISVDAVLGGMTPFGEQARRLGCPLGDYARRTAGQRSPMASDRCTVFMERELNHYLNEDYTATEVLE